ncbi:X-ray repair cross-complementing protein 6 [Lepeophtheirus salmonis]|uniref:X-ray repair cross-complementing protein 6 n=1 Tax=Lepeophtheirus salmonis TaxID=72036 RepID=UPI001AE6C19F|nr:X-ray repair cross-complementing protein 6-like [Lepeophtheirus salmonis]
MDRWDEEDEFDEQNLGNSPWNQGGKDLMIFLVDATNFEGASLALKCAHSTLRTLIWKSSMDLFGLVLYGLDPDSDQNKLSGTKILLPLNPAEPDNILQLEEEIESGSAYPTGKVLLNDAFWQCQSMFDDVSGKVGSKRILLFTDKEAPLDEERKRLLKKAEDFNNTDISVDLIPLKSDFDMKPFFADFLVRANNEASSEDLSLTSPDDLMKIVRRKIHRKRKLGSIYLDFGGGLRPKVSFYNFIGRSNKPPRVYLSKDTNTEVAISRKYMNPDNGQELNSTLDINKYQEYGGRKVVFTPDEVKMITKMGISSEKSGLRILGFRPLSSLKWSHFVRSGTFIYPEEEEVVGSLKVMSSLLIKCLEKEVMAICFYKPRNNWAPSFIALIPQEETREDGAQEIPPGFHLAYLPFSDDLRNVPTRLDCNKSRVLPEQLEAGKKVIHKLRLKNYNSEAFANPELQAHYCLVESLALNRDDVEDFVDTTLPPQDVIQKKLEVVSKEFNEAVYPDGYDPDAKPPPPSKRKDIQGKDKPDDAKKAKTDLEVLDMDSSIRGKSVEKLTVDVLKKFLVAKGVTISHKRKADLVRLVYEYHSQS